MTRQKALAILTAGVPDENSTPDDRAAFLTALNKLAAEHTSTAALEAASFRELEALRTLDEARENTGAVLAAALRS